MWWLRLHPWAPSTLAMCSRSLQNPAGSDCTFLHRRRSATSPVTRGSPLTGSAPIPHCQLPAAPVRLQGQGPLCFPSHRVEGSHTSAWPLGPPYPLSLCQHSFSRCPSVHPAPAHRERPDSQRISASHPVLLLHTSVHLRARVCVCVHLSAAFLWAQ